MCFCAERARLREVYGGATTKPKEMRRYAERYFETALQREMNKATLHIFDDLDNPNPWKAQQTAIRVLDAVSFAGLSATE